MMGRGFCIWLLCKRPMEVSCKLPLWSWTRNFDLFVPRSTRQAPTRKTTTDSRLREHHQSGNVERHLKQQTDHHQQSSVWTCKGHGVMRRRKTFFPAVHKLKDGCLSRPWEMSILPLTFNACHRITSKNGGCWLLSQFNLIWQCRMLIV